MKRGVEIDISLFSLATRNWFLKSILLCGRKKEREADGNAFAMHANEENKIMNNVFMFVMRFRFHFTISKFVCVLRYLCLMNDTWGGDPMSNE